MTMHLVRGMSTLNTKKRKSKSKLDMAQMELDWRRYNKDMRRKNMHSCQFDTLQEYVDYRMGKRKHKPQFKEYEPSKHYVRETEKQKSLSTSDTIPGNGSAKPEPKEYTGDYIVGIATMHKSNLVPVGRGDDPKDYAQMRRN